MLTHDLVLPESTLFYPQVVYTKIDQSPMVRLLAGKLSELRKLLGDVVVEKSEYLAYAIELVTFTKKVLSKEKATLTGKLEDYRHKMIEYTKKCPECRGEVPRKAIVCPSCNHQMVETQTLDKSKSRRWRLESEADIGATMTMATTATEAPFDPAAVSPLSSLTGMYTNAGRE